MQILNKNFYVFLVSLLLSFPGCAQQKPEQQNYKFSEVDSIINHGIQDKAFPGAVILINLYGKTIYNKSYGRFTYEDNSPAVTTTSQFDLASLTKVIATTTAAMICIDRGFFKIDDKVENYIPEFGANGKDKITIRNLLLHNSGLPAWKKYYGRNLSEEKILSDIYLLECEYPTDSKTVYSDLGMVVLGKIIEKVSGISLDKFCEKEIFKPLGMDHTYFNPPDSVKEIIPPTELDHYWRNKLIQGKVHDEIASLLGGTAGNAGLFSNAPDIEKFLIMILQKGRFKNQKIINPETLDLFLKKSSIDRERLLGWDLKSQTGSSAGNLFGKNSFGHTGFTGTSIWIDPDRNLFVVFLTNRVYPSRENKKILSIRPQLHDAVIRSIE